MTAFIEEHREAYGVEPICRSLRRPTTRVPPSPAVPSGPRIGPSRTNAKGLESIRHAHDGSRGRYGARKIWHQLRRARHREMCYAQPTEVESALSAEFDAMLECTAGAGPANDRTRRQCHASGLLG